MDEGIQAGNCVLVKTTLFIKTYKIVSQWVSEREKDTKKIILCDGYFIQCDAILKAINHLSNPSVCCIEKSSFMYKTKKMKK